jgi:phosphocarrier protein
VKKQILKVVNKKGLHARPAALLVQAVSKYKSNIKIIKDEFEIDAKSILGVMTLAATCGTELEFVIEGPDEEDVLSEITSLFNGGFNEE